MEMPTTQPMSLEQMIKLLKQPQVITPDQKMAIAQRLMAITDMLDKIDHQIILAEMQMKICLN